jgi:hypothetical protein
MGRLLLCALDGCKALPLPQGLRVNDNNPAAGFLNL